ncbi:Pfam:aPHC [Seminavis robusta]|uniref:Pfam:aPHC n=1 Tax=Seminavis robusta TaxID=568900 RepID=A0A9N8HIX2_9STRA|nr:Pfam:aPHC [Seminavis robusta]|eukprot:Sro725_g193380.1 Pfam:aPHC (344) ;mRNA; f:43332-44363
MNDPQCNNATQRSKSSKWRLLARTTLLFFLSLVPMIVFVVLTQEGDGTWKDFKSSRCDEYCENSHQCDHEMEERPTVQQPVNAWTSMMYIWAGLWPIVAIRADMGTMVFLAASSYLAIGSFFFHASLVTFWQTVDIAGMYTLFAALVGHGMHTLTGLCWRWIAIPVVAMAILPLFFKDDMEEVGIGSTKIGMGFLSLICLLSAIHLGARIRQKIKRPNPQPRQERSKGLDIILLTAWILLPGVLFVAGFVLRRLDQSKDWCDPDAFFQGHGFWHCATALASLVLWLFFDSANPQNDLKGATDEHYGKGFNTECDDLSETAKSVEAAGEDSEGGFACASEEYSA